MFINIVSVMDIGSSIAIDMKPVQNDIIDFYCDRNFELLCRVCLERIQNDGKMCNIFEATKPVHLPTMIMACASVQVHTFNILCKKKTSVGNLVDCGW